MSRDPHPLFARFLENSVFQKAYRTPRKKNGSTKEDMPNRMPNRITENLPVTKYINIIMEIIRNKIIF